MSLTIVSIDGTEPVTLAEAKAQCYVTSSDDDNLITTLITIAREYAESRIWRQIIEVTYKLTLDSFPDQIILPKPPAIAVSSITYFDTANTSKTFDAAKYQVDTNSEPARITPTLTNSWPSTYDKYNAVTVNFTAGYDASDEQHTISKQLKQAMLMLIKHWYDNRSPVTVSEGRTIDSAEIPMMANALLDMESSREFV